MQKLDQQKLSFLIIPTRFCPPEYQHILDEAYGIWKTIWDYTLKVEHNFQSTLHSDNFTRQSHVSILFYENKIACLTTLNYLDLQNKATMDDSYFNVWPEFAKFKILKDSRHIIACCNFSLQPNFRGKFLGISWKDLMLAINIRHFLHSGCDSFVGEARNNKGMGELSYRIGAQPLAKNVPYHIGESFIDIVRWTKDFNENKTDPKILQLVEHVWKNSYEAINCPKQNVSYKGVKNVA